MGITLLPLAICLLLSLNSQVSGKPSPKHFLIETKENAKVQKNSDYNINAVSFHNAPGGAVISNDYDVNSGVLNNNGGVINSKDYNINARVLNNNGGTINSKDYESAPIRTTERITVINSKDYDINAGSFVNHGHVASFGGK